MTTEELQELIAGIAVRLSDLADSQKRTVEVLRQSLLETRQMLREVSLRQQEISLQMSQLVRQLDQRQTISDLIALSDRVQSGSGGAQWTRGEVHLR